MIQTIEDLDESRADCLTPTTETDSLLEVETIRDHDEAHGLPPDLVVSLMRLRAADPASVTAVARVVAERRRQIEGEGFTTQHDDSLSLGDMALAAACYAENSAHPREFRPGQWLWDSDWWKPSTPERDRCKAMALLIAEDAKAIRAEASGHPQDKGNSGVKGEQKGSNSRDKARQLVARVHQRVADARRDYLHKLSRRLINENQVIVLETLNVKGMTKNHNLAKSISDAGWSTLVRFLEYKAAREGRAIIKIDRWFPSSKACSECSSICDKMPLDVRNWTCPHCGAVHDRDINAARNIRAEGLRVLAGGTPVTADGGMVRRRVGHV